MLLSVLALFSLPSLAGTLYGDVNGDGSVNKKDSLALKKYLADPANTIDLAAADVNADGTVNKKDSLRLKQYLAGWDVVLGREEAVPSEGLKYELNSSAGYYSVTGIGTCTDVDLVIPETYNGLPVSRITAQAFAYCTSLKSVTLPAGLKYILKDAFAGCTNLQNVYFAGTKKQWADISIISPNAVFAHARLQTTLNDGNITYTYADGVLTFSGSGEMADYYCAENERPWKDYANTAKKVIFGDGITYIGSACLSGFKSVTEITLGEDVIWIGAEAFKNCTALTDMHFEGQIEFMAQGVVNGDNQLLDVYITGMTAEEFLVIAKEKLYNNAFNLANIHSEMDVPPDYLFDWSEYLDFPTKRQISETNRTATTGSPYLAGWVSVPYSMKYDTITVDVRAAHLPKGTYCCVANFVLDYSYLESRYARVWTEYGIGGYSGLQRNGVDPEHYNGILSLWDVYCEDDEGNVTTVRAKQLLYEDDSFGGEGTGARSLPPYDWSANKWYNVRLTLSTLENGNTAISMSVYDYETGVESLLSKFDLGVPDVTFEGQYAFFLEDFDVSSAGDVRSMALRDYRIRQTNGEWTKPTSAWVRQNYDKVGSYNFFSKDGMICLITTGVLDCGPNPGWTTLYFNS